MTHEIAPGTYTSRAGLLIRIRSLWQQMRRLEAEGHHSAIHQLWELVRLKIRRGIGPAFYMRAGLYRRELSWTDKLAYVGEVKYERLIHSVHPAEYDHFTRNKLEAYGMLAANGIPTPPVYGVVEGARVPAWNGEVLRSSTDLMRLVSRLGIDTVCFKFVSGTRGRGFYKVKINTHGDTPTATIEPGGNELPLEEFWGMLRKEELFDGYFCQAVIEQHPDVARFNPSSVNTVRTWMVREGAEWDMALAVFRMGIGRSPVDNIAAGGIGCAVDVDTGRLSSAIQRDAGRPIHSRHPVSGAQIEGFVLPMWPEAKALCRRAAKLLPQYLLLSVDVAFGKDGPLVVELGMTPSGVQIESERGQYPLLRRLLKQRKLGEGG